MDEMLDRVVVAVQARFAAQYQLFRGQATLTLAPEKLVDALRLLRDEYTFNTLLDVTAVDYWPQESPRFHVVYQLYAMTEKVRLTLRVPLNGNAPHIPTATGVYTGANWYEREVWDMFGIHFDGHPDPRRIVMPFEWEGHPLRKDYPLGYEEVQFTFNFDEIAASKPRGKEVRQERP